MAHHQKLRTDDFEEGGRNQYEHQHDIRRRDTNDTYEQRNYGRSRTGESSSPDYASTDRIGAYGQNNHRPESGQHRAGHHQTREGDPYGQNNQRGSSNRGNHGHADDSNRGGRSQTGQFEYYRRDNAQFRGYPHDNDQRQYATYRDDNAPSYISYQHQRPGGITPRDYHRDDARVQGHEASRGRDQYSRGFSDRGHDPYQGHYDQGGDNGFRQDRDDRRRFDPRDERDERRGERDRRNSREEFGYGNDYSSSLYDDSSRNRTNRGHDNQDERNDRHRDDRRGFGSGYIDEDRGSMR